MKLVIFFVTFILSQQAFSQEMKGLAKQLKENKTFEEKEQDLIDYSNIKKILVNDGLANEKKKKQKIANKIQKEREKLRVGRYNYPNEEDFWALMTELWLVKNAQELSWDFPKPEYGIETAFKQLLEKFGFYNIKFKVLVINSPNVVHFAFPAGKNEMIFLLSLPFMRSLDLTKVDLSILLLEDFFRVRKGDLKKNMGMDWSFLNTNFYEKKIDKKLISTFLTKLSDVVFKTGFNFQQQYEVTKEMDRVLKSDPGLWGAYFKLLNKINRAVKNDLLYKNYLKIYPSPELQIQWISPKKSII